MTVFSAADYDAPPTALHVEAFLKGATYWPTDTVKQVLAQYEAQLSVDAALDEFEGIAGHSPFLADALPSTRTFTVNAKTFAQNGVLQLGGGIVELVSVNFGNAQAMGGGRWIAKPDNAVARNRPIIWLKYAAGGRLRGWRDDLPIQIDVTARWGYANRFPPIAFQAITQRASINLLRQIENIQSIASISQDGFSKEYDIVGILTQKDVAQGGDKDFFTIATRFRRPIA